MATGVPYGAVPGADGPDVPGGVPGPTGTVTYSATGYALASERVSLGRGLLLTGLVGDVRVRVTAASPGRPVFAAIGPADRVAAYLSGLSAALIWVPARLAARR